MVRTIKLHKVEKAKMGEEYFTYAKENPQYSPTYKTFLVYGYHKNIDHSTGSRDGKRILHVWRK